MERCLEAGQRARAVEAMEDLDRVFKPKPNTMLDQDLEKLEQVQAVTSDLERLDHKYSQKSKNRRRSKNKRRKRPGHNTGNNKK